MSPAFAQLDLLPLLRGAGLSLVLCWVLAYLILRLWRRLRRTPALRFERQPALFTPAEIRFLLALQEAVGSELVIVGKIRLADLIRPRSGQTPQQRQAAFNKVRSKHIDFVLLDPADFGPVLALELDDSSHQRAARIERDAFVDSACADAGLPLLRAPVRARYDTGELRSFVRQAIRTQVKGA